MIIIIEKKLSCSEVLLLNQHCLFSHNYAPDMFIFILVY